MVRLYVLLSVLACAVVVQCVCFVCGALCDVVSVCCCATVLCLFVFACVCFCAFCA